jgi:ABC-type dipeptide/oligopeptide/nickel transport system permease subunit
MNESDERNAMHWFNIENSGDTLFSSGQPGSYDSLTVGMMWSAAHWRIGLLFGMVFVVRSGSGSERRV